MSPHWSFTRDPGVDVAQKADACISMGNVSPPRHEQQYFRRAIELLRAATSLDDPNLDRHLREFLDYYGRYVD
ncbi:hypothetical protein Slin15195_G077690 [Septoria linicola]|uniref:Uncharacterized protein n=1 Tax=Septoria linicola TaxID=215465 RepID=A0A9Q9EKV4_9PEZI|nr:hypothetical protein Slin14017_G038870 [Septoria linicola]USW54450.1 hypothetical protein Slin15195_G077690 [Septoria linicola]